MNDHPLVTEERQLLAEFAENHNGDWARMRRFELLNETCSEEWERVVTAVLLRKQRVDRFIIARQIAWN